VVRTDGLAQLGTNNHTGAFSGWATAEEHDACSGIPVSELEQTSSNAERNTGTPQWALVVGDGPGVTLERLKSVGELELALRHRQEEARVDVGEGHLRAAGLLGSVGAGGGLAEAQHLVDLLGSIVLVTAEDVGFSALSVAKLVHLGLQVSVVSSK
jgi:hypothetical protein